MTAAGFRGRCGSKEDGRRMCAQTERHVMCTCYLRTGKTKEASTLTLAVMHFNCSCIKMGTFCKISGLMAAKGQWGS